MIGFMGAHRTGKTTLARSVASKLGYEFLQTNLSGVFEELGLNPRDEYPFKTRLMVQNKLLDRMSELFGNESKPFVADRTPLDVLMYTWADVGRATQMDDDDQIALTKHIVRAYELANLHFSQVFHIRPGIEIVDEAGKAPPNPAYIEHLDMLCGSIASHPLLNTTVYSFNRDVLDLNLRVSLCLSNVLATMSNSETLH